MRWRGNGDAGGVSTTLWQWRLQESDDVCHACGDCGGGDAVCCRIARGAGVVWDVPEWVSGCVGDCL